MSDWEQDSQALYQNLMRVLNSVRDQAVRREQPQVAWARSWQQQIMHNLQTPTGMPIGRFRGEPGLENYNVSIGRYPGVEADQVKASLDEFEQRLQTAVEFLDTRISEYPNTTDELAAVIDVCAWAHSEWIRIHPLANGNGRSARLWANFIAMRYGLPPFVKLRSRPNHGYAQAGEQAMQGRWKPTADFFHRMLMEIL